MGTGRLLDVAETARMWKRLITVSLLAFTLVACQESKPNNQTLITGSGNVKVTELTIVSSADGGSQLSSGNVTYLITKLDITNDTPQMLVPNVNHFTLVDVTGRRIRAVDTGSSTFTGISNDVTAIKPGDKRTLTVGFRADANTTGTIQYEY